MELVTTLFIFLIALLVLENIIHSRRVKQIPMRITVSGTRGKTSIVRTLVSVFRSHGIQVLAKTTGSEAKYILPDGLEEAIKRRGKATILEQKKLIRKAVKENAQCVISEIMSIHPECHSIETRKIIKPHLTLLTNMRADHIHLAGKSIKELSGYFLNDIEQGSKVFIHEKEISEELASGFLRKNAHQVVVSKDVAQKLRMSQTTINKHMAENLDMVYTVSKHFGIDDDTIEKGIEEAKMDAGGLEIFRLNEGEKEIFFVNAFAANEPESTMKLVDKTIGIMEHNYPATAGLLALRSDRGERSQQWLEYLMKKKNNCFHPLFLTGSHTQVLHRNIEGSETIRERNPERITRSILTACDAGTLVFGIGNFHGMGKRLVDYWKKNGVKFSNVQHLP